MTKWDLNEKKGQIGRAAYDVSVHETLTCTAQDNLRERKQTTRG